MKNDVKGEGSRLSRKKKRDYTQHRGRKTEAAARACRPASGRGRAGPSRPRPQGGPRPPERPLAAAARGRCAPQERGLACLPLLPLAAPHAGRCRRQNQTRPSRPRPSPRAGPAAGRRAARAMVRAGARLPGPFLPAARPPKPPAAWGPGLAGSGLPGWLQGPRPPGRTPRAPRAFRPPLPRSRRLAAPGPRFMPPAPPRAA